MAEGNTALEFIVTAIHLGGQHEEIMQDDRAHQPKSLELVEAIARYLVDEASVADFYIYCGFREPEHQWKMLIMFNKKEMRKEAAAEARQIILSRFLPVPRSLGDEEVQPECNQAMNLIETLGAMGIVSKWTKAEGWRHMTKLVGSHGHFFVPVRNGVDDMTEKHACCRETSKGAFAGWITRGLWALLPGRRGERADLTLDEAIAKMKQ